MVMSSDKFGILRFMVRQNDKNTLKHHVMPNERILKREVGVACIASLSYHLAGFISFIKPVITTY